MAKPKRNLVIEEREVDTGLLKVWKPVLTPVFAGAVEAIEGVVSAQSAGQRRLGT